MIKVRYSNELCIVKREFISCVSHLMLLQLLLQSPLTDLSNNEDIPVATGHTTAEAMIKDFVFLHGCKHALANSKIYYNKDSYIYIRMEMVYIPW